MAQIEKKITNPIQTKDIQGNITATNDEDIVGVIKNTVAREATNSVFCMFLSVANKYDLDLFLGEIIL